MDDCIVNITVSSGECAFPNKKTRKKCKIVNNQIQEKSNPQVNENTITSRNHNTVKSAKNPLQFGIDKKRSSAQSEHFENLLSHPVEPSIEPIFSKLSWESMCQKLNIYPRLKDCLIGRYKLIKLTAIQEVTLPAIVSGADVLVRAQTGSGKTLAYAVPLFNSLINIEPMIIRSSGPFALIILPTRELSTQTFDVFKLLNQSCVRIVPGLLIGGMKRKSQKSSLRKGINVVIGTPKRILDHLEHSTNLNLENIRWLVIDEADRLLEMGFEFDVRRIFENVVKQKDSCEPGALTAKRVQTVLVSATLTPGVEALAGLTLKNPVNCFTQQSGVYESSLDSFHVTSLTAQHKTTAKFALPTGLKHFVLVVPWKLRLISMTAFLLLKCMYHKRGGRLIVFMATQYCVDFHYELLKTVLCNEDEKYLSTELINKISIHKLHGNMEHKERETEFAQFSTSEAGILLTTDVASRGLDLAAIAWIIQYHVTGDEVDYIHRVGRTARAGGRGKALLFLDPEEVGFVDMLKATVGIDFHPLDLGDLLQTVLFHLKSIKQCGKQLYGCRDVEEGTSKLFNLFIQAVDNDDSLIALSELAYISFLRSYASFTGKLRPIFTFKRLHLGHVAHAFCLKQKPKDIASKVTGRFNQMGEPAKKKQKLHLHDNVEGECSQPKCVKRSSLKRSTKKSFKPTDLALRNMFAEYGL